MTLKPLDIFLYKGRGFTSWLIQTLTQSPYNHVAVVVDPDMNLVVESNTGHQSGVRAVDVRRIPMKEVDIYRLKPQYAANKDKVVSYLVGALGSRYDFWGVIWLGLLKIISILTFTGARFHNDFQERRDYFCSELVWEAFAADGLDLVPQTGGSDVTSPGDIAESPMLDKIA